MFTNLKKGLYLSSIFLIVASCKPKQEDPGPSKAEVRQAIDHQNQVFMDSYRDGDLETTAGLYTEKGTVMAPHMKAVTGHEGIQHLMAGMHQSGITEVELGTDELHLLSDGAIEIGHYAVKVGNGQVVDNGKSMVYWKKEGDNWLMYRDMWNSNRPQATPDGNQSE